MIFWKLATHNIAAYKLYYPKSALTPKGHNDDGNESIRKKIVSNTMQKASAKNVAVFGIRHYDGLHLRSKRLKAIEKV